MRKSFSLLCTFSLTAALAGCFSFGDDLGEGVGEAGECIGASIGASLGSIFEQSRLGEDERVRLVGLCGAFETCTAFSPIMRGSEMVVMTDVAGTEALEPFDLVSSDPDVLSTADVDRVCNLTQGAIAAETTGMSTLTVIAESGAVIDTFDLEVAQAASLSLAVPSDAPFSEDGAVLIQATVLDADERILAARGGITWTIADDAVLSVDGELPTGGVLVAQPGQPGTTVVTATADGLEASIEITVP